MQRKYFLGAALGAAVLVLVLFVARFLRRDDGASGPLSVPKTSVVVLPSVSVLQVKASPHAQTAEVTGTVKASLRADIAPKVMSKVAAVYVREGQTVRTGQVLVQLEAGDLQAQVEQAEAAVLAARAALNQSQTGSVIQRTQSRTRVTQAQAALRQAQEQASLVREGSRRQQKLQADQAVRRAQALYQQAAEGVPQASAALRQAREQASLVREGARRQQKLQADQSVRRAQATQTQAEAGVRQANAVLAAARSQLDLVREGARSQQRLQTQAALRQAEAGLKTAQATYNRYKPLAEEGVITPQRFDEITLQLDVARSQFETAQQQASMVNEGARPQEVQQAEEAVRQAQAALGIAQGKAAEAEAAVLEVQEQRSLVYEGARPQEIQQADAQVLAAAAAQRGAVQKTREAYAAVQEAQAQRSLVYEGARPQEVQQAEQAVRQAQSALRLAQASTGENQMKEESVKMLRAQLVQAEASLGATRVQLAYATITAPFAGVVVRRDVDPGAMATPGTPVITLVDPSGFRLEAAVPESRMRGVRLGEAVQVTIDSLDRKLTGIVAQIVPNADPASRTLIVKVALPRVDGLAPGLFGRVRYTTGQSRSLLIPPDALWREESLTGVLTVQNDVAHRRLVTVGKAIGDRVQVLSGLSPGETIVAEGAGRITDGTRIRTNEYQARLGSEAP